MKYGKILLLIVFGLLCIKSEAQIKLEHTFNGYYYPYNFPVVAEADNAQYFSDLQPTFNEATKTFYTRTYNEDYSIRKTIDVRLQGLPSGYNVASVAYTPSFKLSDGTPIIIVTGTSTSINMGSSGYSKCWMFDAESGQMIQQLGTSTFQNSTINTVFEINGKASIVITQGDYDTSTHKVSYVTKIYSLGDSQTSMTAPASEALRYPVEIYDLSGKRIGEFRQSSPSVKIIRYNDGSNQKHLSK